MMIDDDDENIICDEITIDVSGVKSLREFHGILKKELGFPDFYGHNWNAFWDVITGMVPLPRRLVFIGSTNLQQRMPDDFKTLLRLIEKRNTMYAKYSHVCNVSYE